MPALGTALAIKDAAVAVTPVTPFAERGLRKAPTGISGLDEVTGGGLPLGRPTLVCGPVGLQLRQKQS
jgi:RecA/RadA recombinase